MDTVKRLLAAIALCACSEARSTGHDAGRPPEDAGHALDATAPIDGGRTQPPGDAGPQTAIVINELNVSNTDWIELFNPLPAPYDLTGHSISDADPTTGQPRLDRALALPAGVIVEPGGYFVIVRVEPPMPGLQVGAACMVDGVTRCMEIDWGISAPDGDSVFLLNGGNVVAEAVYPPAGVTGNDTWCRLPNGFGQFDACHATPEAENSAP